MTFTDNNGVAEVNLRRNPAGLSEVNAVLSTGIFPAPNVSFVADDVDENASELTLLPTMIIANGKDKALLTLIIKDKGGNILPNQIVEGISTNPTIQFSPAKQVSPGHYEIEATGTKSGSAQLSVKVNGIDFKKQKTLQLHADTTTWQVKSVDVDRTTMIVGDKGVNYQATIVDANDNILPNVIVSWKLQGLADDYDFSTYTDTKGIARTKVTSTVAGILKMSAYLDLNNHKSIQDVKVIPTDIDANKSTFSSNRQSIGGNDKDSALLTVNLMDKYSNTIDGKTVLIKTTSGTAHLNTNPLQSVGNGRYETSITSNLKNDIVLTAQAEGITIAKPVTIKVTIPKPDIIFDKKIQQETYISAPVMPLGYTGLPNNLNVMWSSSDPSIAAIDTLNGKISLKKAGTVIITLQTSGNEQYQPTQNSYPLVIQKASPHLQLTSSNIITSVWNDGIPQKVDVLFGNTDAKNIPLSYISDDQHIATIDTQGTITEVKPGKTKIQIKSDPTDQFLADATTVQYEQDKGTLQIAFTKKDIIVSVTDNNIGVQQPILPLPREAQGVWSAKDPSIVAIKPDGVIVKINPGKTDIILTSKENDYFYESQGSYSMDVRQVPHVIVSSVTRRVDKTRNESSTPNTNTPIKWTPVYDQDQLSFSWLPPDTLMGSYDVNIELWNGNNKTKQIFEYKSANILNGQKITSIFKIDQGLFSRNQLKIKVIIFDLFDHDPVTNTGRQYATEYPLDVKPIDPLYMDLELMGAIEFIVSNDPSKTRGSCQQTLLDDEVYVIAKPKFTLGGKSAPFLAPVKVSHRLVDIQGFSSRSTVNYDDEDTYRTRVVNKSIVSNSSKLAMKEKCWAPVLGGTDSGSGTLITYVTIAGRTQEFKQHVKWDGNGISSLNDIEKINQL